MKRLKRAWQWLGLGETAPVPAPRVSVIVPAYNAEATLHEALASIQAQTFQDWEAVIVDDGSTDASPSLALAAAQAEPRFRTVSQPNRGASAARNSGIAHARGEWLVFLDADDWLAPTHLEAMTGALAADPDLDAVVCKWVTVHPDGRHGPVQKGVELDQLFATSVGSCPFAIHACLVRKRLVEDVGGYNEDLRTCEEWHLWQKIARTGARFGAVDQVLAFYRRQSLHTLSRTSDQVLEDALRVIDLGLSSCEGVDPADEGFADALARSKHFALIYWGTALACKGRSAEPLWARFDEGAEFTFGEGAIAKTIVRAMAFSLDTFEEALPDIWPQVRPQILAMLRRLETATGLPRLAARVTRRLACDIILARPDGPPCVVEGFHGVSLEACDDITDLMVPLAEAEAVVATVTVAGERVGVLWLPVIGDRVPAGVIKDAMASRLAGQIAAKVVANLPSDSVPPKRRTDPSFLADALLGESSASAGSPVVVSHDGEVPLALELTEALPDVMVGAGEEIALAACIGGVAVARCRIPARGGHIAAKALERAIKTLAGAELTRACLRQAVVGRNIAGLEEMRVRLCRGTEAPPCPPSPVAGPLSSNRIVEQLLTESGAGPVSAVGRGLFEHMFAKAPDPWKYTGAYETVKYEQTLSLLPPRPIRNALEIACAEGHFTEMLAGRVDKLIAADISQIALERAAARCRHLTNVSYEHLDLHKDVLGRDFDLIVCSEVLYFLGDRESLTAAAGRIADALADDGQLIMAHANLIADEPDEPGFDWPHHSYGARMISDVFSAVPGLQLDREIRTPLYRVQAFRKTASRSTQPMEAETIVLDEQPTPVPESVAATVRWQGGYRAKSFSERSGWAKSIPILAYHRIAPPEPGLAGRYNVDPDAFARQMAYLDDAGFHAIGWESLAIHLRYGLPLPGRPVMLTFDDGYRDFKEIAFPILHKHGFIATVFVCPAHVGQTNSWDGGTVGLLDWTEIADLAAGGVAFGAHSLTHVPLTGLSLAEARAELTASRKKLENHLGSEVSIMAYPHGDVDPLVEQLAEAAGFAICVTTHDRHCRLSDRPTALPRVGVHGAMSFERFVAAVSGDVDRSAGPVQKLCTFMESLNRPDSALETMRRWAERCSSQGDFQFHLARLLERRDAPGEALDAYRRAADLEPGRAAYAVNLAAACARQGLRDDALAVVERALSRLPESAELLLQLASLLLEAGRPAEAEAALRKVIDLDGKLVQAHDRLIVACERQGRLDEAVAVAERAVSLFPENAGLARRLKAAGKAARQAVPNAR